MIEDAKLFDALAALSLGRNVAGLLAAFELATDEDLLRVLAERLLRAVFDDQRTEWGGTSPSLLNGDGSRPPNSDMAGQALRMIGMLIL